MSRRGLLIAGLLGTAVAVVTAALALGAPPKIDREALRAAADVRTSALTELMRLITKLGSFYATVPAVLAAAVLLRARGLQREGLAAVAALALTVAAVQLLKEVAIERPRPAHPLGDATGGAYPSGHAAKAMAYVWIPLLARDVRAHWRRIALGTAIAVALLVGISRIYLHVHFLTDVAGGWAVGLAAFAAVTAAIARRA